jgi:SAM-dependent methyltransferase
METNMNDSIETVVRERYGAVATSGLSNRNEGVRAVAEAFGYSPEELSAIPAESNMGLSCGNPTALANLREGEVVVDLGSGGGLDVFLAARKVGPTGKAIGIDMTPQMIELARKNARSSGLGNVEFHQAMIDRIPLPDASADVVISNCVINLASDKPAVFREIFRVLKPGGRVAVSDIALKKPLPRELEKSVQAYVGCIAGAILVDDYVGGLKSAGFENVHVVDSGSDLNAYAKVEGQGGCCSPAAQTTAGSCCGSSATEAKATTSCCGTDSGKAELHGAIADLLSRHNVNDYAASVKVYAMKPRG